MGSHDQSHQIVKGKRTKRQRSSSPFGFAVTDSSSSGSGDGCVGRGDRERGVLVDDYYSTSSPTTSGEIYESTEEEEDMANCLIMLAQGEAPRQIQGNKVVEKFNYRKFSEIVTSTNKAGFYVYECKTCNRSFPSFQALGGHRASHKKPKAAAEAKSSSVAVLAPLKDVDSEEGQQLNKRSPPHPLSLQAVGNNNTKGNKIHECSICGSEFTSGQALGGHMRRHRAVAATGNNNQVTAAMISGNIDTNNIINTDDQHQVKPAARSILPLDLNLPAPEDDHHLRDSKFQFGSTQQALVFSAPALVDCHY